MPNSANIPLTGILLFDQVEVLDWAGPYEVLSRASQTDGQPCFQVQTIAPTGMVNCMGGVKVIAESTLDQAPSYDLLVVPGGPGAREPVDPEPLLAFITAQAQQGALIASVCTGSYLLAWAGLLAGLKATTHSMRLKEFGETFPATMAVKDKIVDQGRMITAGGVATGIDLALYLVERFHGQKARQWEAARLDGNYR